jgi:hypothetical protein
VAAGLVVTWSPSTMLVRNAHNVIARLDQHDPALVPWADRMAEGQLLARYRLELQAWPEDLAVPDQVARMAIALGLPPRDVEDFEREPRIGGFDKIPRLADCDVVIWRLRCERAVRDLVGQGVHVDEIRERLQRWSWKPAALVAWARERGITVPPKPRHQWKPITEPIRRGRRVVVGQAAVDSGDETCGRCGLCRTRDRASGWWRYYWPGAALRLLQRTPACQEARR